MEWVETTGDTLEEAKNLALDQLGVAEDDAEFEIVEEPRPGLFGRTRGEARVRARVRPTTPRGKTERRDRNGRGERSDRGERRDGNRDRNGRDGNRDRKPRNESRSRDEAPTADFLNGLVSAFGTTGQVSVNREGEEIEVRVDGTELGLLVGPGGGTLLAIQDLTRVASQRRLGDQDTRLRVDIAGYRERRRAALGRFAEKVAEEVKATGSARRLEPMNSADRKIVHDTLIEFEGVTTRSEGEDPKRRVVVEPASA